MKLKPNNRGIGMAAIPKLKLYLPRLLKGRTLTATLILSVVIFFQFFLGLQKQKNWFTLLSQLLLVHKSLSFTKSDTLFHCSQFSHKTHSYFPQKLFFSFSRKGKKSGHKYCCLGTLCDWLFQHCCCVYVLVFFTIGILDYSNIKHRRAFCKTRPFQFKHILELCIERQPSKIGLVQELL